MGRRLRLPMVALRSASPDPARAIPAPVEQLDLATVVRVLEAVSGEIVLERLIDTLMRMAIEHAGAGRGVLVFPKGDDLQIEAEAAIAAGAIVVALKSEPVTGAALSESILRHVARTQESVILDDAATPGSFGADAYIRERGVRSILCLPLVKQARLGGILYLENSLVPHAFTPARIAILKLLAAQAAISLETIHLYSDVKERETNIRRLVDANIIGIIIWKADGAITEANDAFLAMVGYDRDDFAADRIGWSSITPPEWAEIEARAEAELAATGTTEPYEKEYVHKDGSRIPVLIGAALLEGKQDEGVAFVLDLTERKRAEESLRESERRYHQAQMELAHANRVITMGQLTASIAHEVKQPLAAAVTGAEAGLRWLARNPPDVQEARDVLARIVRSGIRASDVIDRIHALVKKTPPRKEQLDVSETVREVVALTLGEAQRNGVAIETRLAPDLPLVSADRVQLQQVLLNLIVNAIEAMSGVDEGRRELWIGTEEDAAGGVLVEVKDTGPGLDPVEAERVFDAFRTSKAGGMGMGLSICRSILEAHGGRIWTRANLPRGAVFQFNLPAQPGAAPLS